ncbi:MAG TPA: bifunctional UDP-N-acetylmuramoyl-tripeptide:D-alanyl-D-alanine ligase/alanine racemase [Bacteroidales bacterium]|nr:bifunctional UDP-N-acetylmuramoyl-tripeptide:D-alanyl-D-alanine ligase/alanine racemase [Bacteroidales bacterium]
MMDNELRGVNKRITTGEAAGITGGKLYGSSDLEIREIITDSRQSVFQEGTAFFAIKGPNHDGHNFLSQLYRRSVRIFFVENLPSGIENFTDAAFIVTNNSVKALQLLASERRRHFKGKVIAVTGSAGKTVVKEWLGDIIGSVTPVVRSPKSYNSQIGVPLSVWKLENKYNVGIIEAGISQPGEMEKLRRIIEPDIGVITNIGDAHSENFASQKEKALEKLKLFINSEVIVFCRDHVLLRDIILSDKIYSKKKLAGWSFTDENAPIFIKITRISSGRTDITVKSGDTIFESYIPFDDRASIENAAAVITTCLIAGLSYETIRECLPRLASVAMRMEIKAGINGCLLVEDYYNSDPGSLKMALEYLKSHNNRRSVLILSDFLQTGRDEKELYGEVAGLLNTFKIDRFIGIGPVLQRNKELFPTGSLFYDSTQDFCREIERTDFSGEVILLKGARKFEFERISNLLVQKIHQTMLEINLDAVSYNINEIRKHLNPGTRIMAMVKASAYGTGPSGIASLLEFHRVDYLAAANADEGVELRDAGVSLPVVVMNPEPHAFNLIIKYNLEPVIYSFTMLRRFAETASRHGLTDFPVHIKIDTGMHRLGFMPSETDVLIEEIKAARSLRVASVFSHLSASEDPEYDFFTRKQAQLLKETADKIKEALGYGFLVHLLNTAGIFRFPEYQFDMVRPGIGIFGITGTPDLNLHEAVRYVTRILQIKNVPAGEPVGYGCKDVSEEDRRIAILPVGYADGFDRRLGNGRGSFFIKNGFAPVVGNICMDLTMADITGIDAEEGDEAEIFGKNISLEEFSKKVGTIPYEVLTSIPSRVKRILTRE